MFVWRHIWFFVSEPLENVTSIKGNNEIAYLWFPLLLLLQLTEQYKVASAIYSLRRLFINKMSQELPTLRNLFWNTKQKSDVATF